MELIGAVERELGDEALVDRARAGNRDAFARLIAPRADRVLRTARAILGSETEAHDAAQEALVSAWTHLPRLRDAASFDAWIFRILRNECREALRRRPRVRVIDLSAAELEPSTAAVESDPASASLDTAAVRAAFARLSVDDRTVLLLHHLHGLDLNEVAGRLGVPVGTAKSRLWSARRALERALETQR